MTTTTSSPSTAMAIAEPVFTQQEPLALAGFLADYTGLTREAYAPDLRQYANWCQQHHLHLFQVRRADIECFARDLEACGRSRAPVTRLSGTQIVTLLPCACDTAAPTLAPSSWRGRPARC